TFTLTPSAGYVTSSVGGTCGGTLNGNSYTTRAITASCTVTAAFASQTYTVTASAGTGGSISPSGSITVSKGSTRQFTVTPSAGYKVSSVGGSCGGTLNGNSYTTNAINGNCTVAAAFAPLTYTVTASAGTGGSISPAGANTVNYGTAKTFTLTPSAGYKVSSVGGTCGGTLNGNSYTTRAITASCTVTAAFTSTTASAYTVTASAAANGTLSPVGTFSVASGTTKSFSVTPNPGYASQYVGTCPGYFGSGTYIAGPITSNCTVSMTFYRVYTITASAGVGGTISPSGSVVVNSGFAKAFTLTPSTGYKVSSVGGTCGGTLSGNTYTTKDVTANCTVTAAFTSTTASTYTVTASAGANGTLSPVGTFSVASGTTKSFSVTPKSGYASKAGGTCPGYFGAGTYFAGPITSNCTVVMTFYSI
ncbi:MAG: hypothetical protein LBH10_00250, partial [Burkholderiaceae bacterium]|nr:hypothetical protein [Burkholderiaceae bacterium]